MKRKKEAIERHKRYFSQLNNKEPKVEERKDCIIVTSKRGKEKSIITKNNKFIEKMNIIRCSNEKGFISFESQWYNPNYVYYFKLKGKKVDRKIITENIKLYRGIKLILLELQRYFYIEYLRDEDFNISDEGELLFNNFNSLVLLHNRKKSKCECGQDLIIDLEAFFRSKDNVFVSQYKCVECLKQ